MTLICRVAFYHDTFDRAILYIDLPVPLIIRTTDELVAVPRDGDDETVLPFLLAKRFSQRRNLDRQIVLFDKLSRPDALEKHILRDDLSAVIDQLEQQIECFWI